MTTSYGGVLSEEAANRMVECLVEATVSVPCEIREAGESTECGEWETVARESGDKLDKGG